MAATESGGNLERPALWIVIGLFLTLSIIWAAYPRIYDHYHPKPKWPGELGSFGPSIAVSNFWRACLLALLGFPQLRLRHCFHGVSTILFWVFLLLSLGMALDAWAFSFSIRFWTITLKELSPRSRYVFEISRPVWRYVTPTTFAIGLLNIGLAAFYRRRSSYRTQVSSQIVEGLETWFSGDGLRSIAACYFLAMRIQGKFLIVGLVLSGLLVCSVSGKKNRLHAEGNC